MSQTGLDVLETSQRSPALGRQLFLDIIHGRTIQ